MLEDVLVALASLTLACTVILALLPWLLRRRGVEMRRTRFGITLVFDSEDADRTPVRLLNVNGTFQSVSYVPEGLRFELACEYHRAMADVIEGLGRRADGARRRVVVMGGGGYSLPKYLAAHVPYVSVDVIEVDPAITRIARESFFLDECLESTHAESDGRLQLVNDDAWGFLRAADEPYEVIVNDAFSGRRPLGLASPHSRASVASPTPSPARYMHSTAETSPAQGHSTGAPVYSTTTVFFCTAAMRAIRLFWQSGRRRVRRSVSGLTKLSGWPANTTATSACSAADTARKNSFSSRSSMSAGKPVTYPARRPFSSAASSAPMAEELGCPSP